ncbi:uncharacterized protein LOC134441212 [Engraulis encrasicolus]|uniref:uncharacterized protein LOC134441212 n=1 Tax=Engraulis encrasicolus TaxID=184585 RepID=UPI002FD05096
MFFSNPAGPQNNKRQSETVSKKVWIIGDCPTLMFLQSYIAKGVNKMLYCRPVEHLTLAKVIQELLDLQFPPFGWPIPDMLILHLGSSCDIPHGNLEDTLLKIQEHLVIVRRIFPQCALVWSDILSSSYRESEGHQPAHSADLASYRHEVNLRLRNIVKEFGGAAIAHGNIQPEHFEYGGRRFLPKGQQLFQQNIMEFMDEWRWDEFSLPGTAEPTGHTDQPLAWQTGRQPMTGCGNQGAAQKVVWICGEAFCQKARELAEQEGIRLSCGTVEVNVVWKIAWKRYMTLKCFVPTLLRSEPRVIRQPDMVILYMSESEMRKNMEQVVIHMKRELTLLNTIFPKCLLVWSDIFPGLDSTGSGVTDYVNSRMHAFVAELGGGVVAHKNIGPELYQSMLKKSVATNTAKQMANHNIQDFVWRWKTEGNAL